MLETGAAVQMVPLNSSVQHPHTQPIILQQQELLPPGVQQQQQQQLSQEELLDNAGEANMSCPNLMTTMPATSLHQVRGSCKNQIITWTTLTAQ